MTKRSKLECPLETVREDMRDHSMSIVRDDEHGRHLRFRSTTRGSVYWFDILTWPGSLMIDGDCGTYVFRRIDDMFSFFRNDAGRDLSINPGYWAEKVQAACPHGGVKKFNWATFDARVREWLAESFDGAEDAGRAKRITDECLERLRFVEQDQHGAWTFIREFEHEGWRFTDWESSCEEFTFHYLWCCWAIVLGIAKYDALKLARSEAANDIEEDLGSAVPMLGYVWTGGSARPSDAPLFSVEPPDSKFRGKYTVAAAMSEVFKRAVA